MAEEMTSSDESPKPKGCVVIKAERCKGCSFCVKFCPTQALAMSDQLNAKGYSLPVLANPMACNGCDLCGLYCPDFAIYGYRLNRKKKERDNG